MDILWKLQSSLHLFMSNPWSCLEYPFPPNVLYMFPGLYLSWDIFVLAQDDPIG